MSCGSVVGRSAAGQQEILLGKRMLETMVMDPPRVMDPALNWKTARNGRRRALRRARTSFTGIGEMFLPMRCRGEDFAGSSSSNGEIPVSESEKLGVNILGRRFSDASVESVPIKKRRFNLASTVTPSPSCSCINEFVNEFQEGKNSSCLSSYHTRGSTSRKGPSRKKQPKDSMEQSSLDAADFSGIFILAAVACKTDAEALMHNEQSPDERKHTEVVESVESCTPSNTHEKLRTSEKLPSDGDNLLEPSVSVLDIKHPEGTGSDVSDDPLGCQQKEPEAMKVVDTPRDSRLHWDLNVTMDAWDTCDDASPDSAPPGFENVIVNGSTQKNNVPDTREQSQERGIGHLPLAAGIPTSTSAKYDELSCDVDGSTIAAAAVDDLPGANCESTDAAERALDAPFPCVSANTPTSPEADCDKYGTDFQKGATGEQLVKLRRPAAPYSADEVLPILKKVDYDDDDSQYEDGEVRESGSHCWQDGGLDEAEVNRRNYRSYSDCEDVSDGPDLLSANAMPNGNCGLSAYSSAVELPHKDLSYAFPETLTRGPSYDSHMDVESRMKIDENVRERLYSNHSTMNGRSRIFEVDTGMSVPSVSSDIRRQIGDAPQEYISKFSFDGWGELPERSCRHRSSDKPDSFDTNDGASSYEVSKRRDSVGCLERPFIGDMRSLSYDRNNRTQGNLGRSNVPYNRDNDAQRSTERARKRQNGLAISGGAVNRGEQKSTARRRSPDFYQLPSNAIAATVAKMESNGFVVAPDGTLVRAESAGNRAVVRSNYSSNGSRCILSRRDPAADSIRVSKARDSRGWSPPSQFPVSRDRAGNYRSGPKNIFIRDGSRSISPRKSPLYLPRSSNQPRSRSVSPYSWHPNSVRRDTKSNRSLNLCQRSRSPNFRALEFRVGRATSPRGRLHYKERDMFYSPSSRTLSPSAPRLQRRSNYVVEEHNRYKKGRPQVRNHQQHNGRFNSSRSPSRSRPDEQFRSNHPRRTSRNTYGGFTNSNRAQDGQRERGSRYNIDPTEGVRRYQDDPRERSSHYRDDGRERGSQHHDYPRERGNHYGLPIRCFRNDNSHDGYESCPGANNSSDNENGQRRSLDRDFQNRSGDVQQETSEVA